jgi:hypothetical protein
METHQELNPETRGATAGAVTFIPESEREHRHDKTVIRLLTAMTVLLSLLVVGLAAGAVWMAMEYQRAQAAFESQAKAWRDDTTHALAVTQGLARDLLVRQDATSAEIVARANQAKAKLAELDRLRGAMGSIPADPFGKADYAIRLSILTLDEARVMGRYTADTAVMMGRQLDLTPAQRQLLSDLRQAKPAGTPKPPQAPASK